MKEKSEKAGLKFNIQKMKIAVAAVDSTGVQAGVTLAADHLVAEDHGIQCYHFMANRWEKMETVTDFIFLGSKITADSNCSHEIKVKVKVAQSYSTLCDPMEFSTVHGILQARILEWAAFPFSS